MVARKRLPCRGDSGDSNSDCLEIRHSGQPLPSSPLTRNHDDDVSGMVPEAMLRRRKKMKTTTISASSSVSKMIWSKNDELVILGSIVDFENETKLSYRSDWDGFYGYIKYFMEASFSKQQLMDKIKNLKKRFINNQARSNDGKGPSFTNTDDDEIFKTSMIIWATNETERASNENIDKAKDVPCEEHESVDENMDQAKDVPYAEHERVNENMDQENVDVPYAEHERVNENMDQENVDVPYAEHEQINENMDQENVDVPDAEHEQVNENMDQENVDVPDAEHEQVNENMDQENVDVPDAEHEPVSDITMEIGKGENEKCEEDGVDEFCALQDALEATTLFQSLGKYQQKRMLQNLKNLGTQRRKELADEWKALLAEEMKLCAKKLTLSAKLASA